MLRATANVCLRLRRVNSPGRRHLPLTTQLSLLTGRATGREHVSVPSLQCTDTLLLWHALLFLGAIICLSVGRFHPDSCHFFPSRRQPE
ncbi:hypothetical protein SKAU_G00303100 [Synaphobranchus kaupii]|uniref:Uncharacterized protein n=1 Tax=Synaphobranchus kaupii TaxID=118154 RepID=A0A9Q1EW31_SYNKA|nr:hypothetical protein SKAU_G00303100 [Synaphobranchus kaupii]